MLSLLNETYKKHKNLFKNNKKFGFYLKINKELIKNNKIISNFHLQPTYFPVEIINNEIIVPDIDFRLYNIKYKYNDNPIKLKINIKSPLNFSTCFGFFNKNHQILFNFEQKIEKNIQSIKTILQYPYFSTNINHYIFNFNINYLTNFQFLIGNNKNSIGLQLIKNYIEKNKSFSLLYHYNFHKLLFQTIFSVDIEKKILFRYQKEIKNNYNIGIEYSINNKLNSLFILSWKIQINNSLIKSLIKSNGFIQTKFKYNLSNNSKFLINGSLDHKLCNYLFGIGLKWE